MVKQNRTQSMSVVKLPELAVIKKSELLKAINLSGTADNLRLNSKEMKVLLF